MMTKIEHLQNIFGICYLISLPIITLFWANKDFFQYSYKFDSSTVIEAEVPPTPYYTSPLWRINLEFKYSGKSYKKQFPRKMNEDIGDKTVLHVIESPLDSESPIFVRDFIIPHIYEYVFLYIILYFFIFKFLPALLKKGKTYK